VFPWTDPVTQVLAGLPQLMLEMYRMHRDGSVAEQLERAAKLRAGQLNQAHQFRLEEEVWKAKLHVLGQVEKSRVDAVRAENPFGHLPGDVVHEQVEQLTSRRQRPVLLIAPFLHTGRTKQDNVDQPFAYNVSIRSAWQDSRWSSDMRVDAGLVGQPLLRVDMAVRGIRERLADLPVVLVHGFVDRQERVRLEVIAWNLISESADGSGSEAIEIQISDSDSLAGTEAADSPDRVGLASTQLCAVLAEWFYVARGRVPRRHREVPAHLALGTAAGSLVALSLGLNRGNVDPLTALVHQAILHADLGETDLLTDAVDSAVGLIRTADEETAESLLRRLKHATKDVATAGTNSGADSGLLVHRVDAEYKRAARALLARTMYG
jgi:hypothetical protein